MPQAFSTPELHSPVCRSLTSSANASFISRSCGGGLLVFGRLRAGREKAAYYGTLGETKEVCLLKGLFKFVLAIAAAAIVAVGGINACVVLSANPAIRRWTNTSSPGSRHATLLSCLGRACCPMARFSPILQKRVDAAIDLYFRGVAPIVVMSGDGRESNYDEPNAMKAYAIAQGVPESAIYCDGGGYHTYDTMWRVANVYGAQSVAGHAEIPPISRGV